MKSKIWGRNFNSEEGVVTAYQEAVMNWTENDFADCSLSWFARIHKWIDCNGAWFKKLKLSRFLVLFFYNDTAYSFADIAVSIFSKYWFMNLEAKSYFSSPRILIFRLFNEKKKTHWIIQISFQNLKKNSHLMTYTGFRFCKLVQAIQLTIALT